MPMTKRRFVTPEEMVDEDLGELSAATRFLAVVLRMWADDEGRARLNFASLKGGAYANDESTTPESLLLDVIDLERVGFMQSWIAGDGKQYYQIDPRFHTAPEKPRPSLLPPPPPRPSGSNPDAVPVEEREGEGGEGEARSAPALPPMFCPDHSPAGSGGVPCGPCRDKRMVHEAAIRELRAQPRGE